MDTPNKTDNQMLYPDLPNTRCPRNLFLSIVSKEYLTALYMVEPSIFPQDWRKMKVISPTIAWRALNESVTQYLNVRYSDQGLHIGKTETAILSMAQKISENVSNDIIQTSGCDTSQSRQVTAVEGEFDLLVEKLQIVFDLVANQVAKLTGRKVYILISTEGTGTQKRKPTKRESFSPSD